MVHGWRVDEVALVAVSADWLQASRVTLLGNARSRAIKASHTKCSKQSPLDATSKHVRAQSRRVWPRYAKCWPCKRPAHRASKWLP